jgi:hypothetical protein
MFVKDSTVVFSWIQRVEIEDAVAMLVIYVQCNWLWLL